MLFEAQIYLLGLATAIYLVFNISRFLQLYLRSSSLPRYKHGQESWAFITGGSDGLGLAFAKELCRHRFNVILLGHKPEELESAKTTLKLLAPEVDVRILVVNAISSPLSVLEEALATVADLNITILINNVGGPPYRNGSVFDTIVEYTADQVDNTLNINARFMAHLTRLLIPLLSRNGPSLIMNISSGSHVGTPYVAIYGGAKAFVASFSTAIGLEAMAEGWPIEVIAIIPGLVRTGSHKVPIAWGTPSAEVYARAALDRVGCGHLVVYGYWRHAVQFGLFDMLPTKLMQLILTKEMKSKRDSQGKDI